MTLDISGDPSHPPSDGARSSYPRAPPVSTFPVIGLGFNEARREAFVAVQLGLAREEFNFRPTPIEREGLAYYNSIFYNAEAMGATYGMAAGGLLGILLATRHKNPFKMIRWPLEKIRLNPRYQLAFSRGVVVYLTAQLGKTYGTISSGVRAYNRVREEQKLDPNMQRYLQLRSAWVSQKGQLGGVGGLAREMQREKDNAKKYLETGKAELHGSADDQSLGGIDFVYEDEKKAEPPTPVAAKRSPVRNVGGRPNPPSTDDDDDPFAYGGLSEQQQEPEYPSRQATREEQEQSGSAWERLRRGEGSPTVRSERTPRPPREEQWPTESRRGGFRGGQGAANEDSFSFSDSEEGRRQAKEEAQREFDARIERERQVASGDAYDGESNSRRGGGKWD